MHASVKGVPVIEAELSKLVAQHIVQYEGFVQTSKAKELWLQQNLVAQHKPFRLKCNLRECVQFDNLCERDCSGTQPAEFCRSMPI